METGMMVCIGAWLSFPWLRVTAAGNGHLTWVWMDGWHRCILTAGGKGGGRRQEVGAELGKKEGGG